MGGTHDGASGSKTAAPWRASSLASTLRATRVTGIEKKERQKQTDEDIVGTSTSPTSEGVRARGEAKTREAASVDSLEGRERNLNNN
jgi:hypothetical protein